NYADNCVAQLILIIFPGAFLIPYFIALIFEGIPLLHLELALGQCLRKGSISAWSAISPYLGGVGVGSWMVSVLVSLYYNTVLTWVMWYFINSFQEPLPWSVCPLNENRTGLNEECYESTAVNYFWYRKTLNITPDITESGTLQWWLVLCLAACWAIVYLCTIRGIETTGKSCSDYTRYDLSVSGSGLAFIVFTQAIILMPGSQAWAILFFTMLFSLGLSSMFGNIEGVFTPLLELQIISKSIPKELLSGIICLVSFLIALCFTLSSGSYWIDIFDRYAGSVPLLVIAFFEVTGVVYVYKIKRFSEDVKWMTGRKLNLYWQITWRFISPLLLLIVFVAFVTLQIQKPPTYTAWNPKHEDFPMKEEKAYPPWVQAICVLLAVLPCIFVPLVALFQLVKKMWRSKDPSFLPPEVFSCQEVNRNFSHPKK
uniref:S6A18 protein n=1 Tax=Anas zonorhyncha TaxID=75864 RepID=A0A8B9TZK8_9AVES